jgi:hypothetical protein
MAHIGHSRPQCAGPTQPRVALAQQTASLQPVPRQPKFSLAPSRYGDEHRCVHTGVSLVFTRLDLHASKWWPCQATCKNTRGKNTAPGRAETSPCGGLACRRWRTGIHQANNGRNVQNGVHDGCGAEHAQPDAILACGRTWLNSFYSFKEMLGQKSSQSSFCRLGCLAGPRQYPGGFLQWHSHRVHIFGSCGGLLCLACHLGVVASTNPSSQAP